MSNETKTKVILERGVNTPQTEGIKKFQNYEWNKQGDYFKKLSLYKESPVTNVSSHTSTLQLRISR